MHVLRVILGYWYQNKILKEDLRAILLNYHIPVKERIPSFYTIEEIKKIESSVDRSSAVGKRNYAMLLLATRLGLRASDISMLTFSNINWKSNEIILHQQKTGKKIILPLLTDVGNAIVEYIKYGRPISNSKRIFFTGTAPFIEASPKVVSGAINVLISNTGITLGNRHHGPHSMRHSLATSMLQSGIPMSTISSTLGHEHTDTTMKYLRIDITSLMKCALAVSLIDDSFYIQKGGIFYE